MNNLKWEEFEKVEIRVGKIIDVTDFPKARNPSYKLKIDFGEFGIKNSSAQITEVYNKEDLFHKQIIAVINFPPKQIANFISECLVLGIVLDNKEVVLLQPEQEVKNGSRIR
jgi:tRNA-binding protein|tara:strand:+ start:3846 stop:4181 length:336 start_codon:yes stop_codon:yes gene_type:complete